LLLGLLVHGVETIIFNKKFSQESLDSWKNVQPAIFILLPDSLSDMKLAIVIL